MPQHVSHSLKLAWAHDLRSRLVLLIYFEGKSFLRMVNQSDIAGSADPFMKSARATSSAYGVDVDVPLCFLL